MQHASTEPCHVHPAYSPSHRPDLSTFPSCIRASDRISEHHIILSKEEQHHPSPDSFFVSSQIEAVLAQLCTEPGLLNICYLNPASDRQIWGAGLISHGNIGSTAPLGSIRGTSFWPLPPLPSGSLPAFRSDWAGVCRQDLQQLAPTLLR